MGEERARRGQGEGEQRRRLLVTAALRYIQCGLECDDSTGVGRCDKHAPAAGADAGMIAAGDRVRNLEYGTAGVAVGETAILLHPPLPLVCHLARMERG